MQARSEVRAQALAAIWRAVRAIPRGEVASYGAIARQAGLPGRARLVGHALKVAPAAARLPWHRVVGVGGRISFAPGSANFVRQCERLAAEGVAVLGGRIVSSSRAALDELLWKPRAASRPRARRARTR